ncbi:hypothetical protein EB796_004942 [Bugula neritina]|uniref:Uncharacterized protein n=1 Tax=Bugula neritina TaxID=10212 RepID=A0A7J7KDL8_BUGNE|nr:hypothetical protein EB796_004942 [Bugula neritina]
MCLTSPRGHSSLSCRTLPVVVFMVFVLSAAVLTCRALFSHSHQQRELAKSVCLHREKWYMTQAANSRCRADASQMTQRLALLKTSAPH